MRLWALSCSIASLACAFSATADAQLRRCIAAKCEFVGGSTLAARVYRDIFNCYSSRADGVFSTSATYTGYSVQYPTVENPGCTRQGHANDVILYEPVGIDAALGAWTTADPANWGSPAPFASATDVGNTIAFLDTAAGVTTTPYPQIQFSAADTYATSTQISQAQSAAGEAVFQLPIFATPITIPVGMTPKVMLLKTDVCNLFAGATSTSAAGVTFSELVVRADGSGASFILSNWLAQNCPSSLGFNSANGFPSTLPSWTAVNAANGNHLGAPVMVSGGDGVAGALASTPNAIGYDSPDTVYPVITNSTAYPAYVNGFLPTVANTRAHLEHAKYPSSYDVLTIGQTVNDSLVSPSNSVGYPIVGYTFWDTYSCYSTSLAGGLIGGPDQGAILLDLINYVYAMGDGSVGNILANQGFARAVPAVVTLLKGTGGPLNAIGGIQNSACPAE